MKQPTATKPQIVEGSGDVFADLGFPNPALARAKAELAAQIEETIRKRKLTQVKAARLMGIDQPKVSAIVRGRLSDFSLDRLVTCLAGLNREVQFRFVNRYRGAKSRTTAENGPARRRKLSAAGR